MPGARREYRLEGAGPAEPITDRPPRRRPRMLDAFDRASDRKARAALGAASGKNLAPADGLHAGAKPMRPRAAQLGWLVSAFHLVAFENAFRRREVTHAPRRRKPRGRQAEKALH